MAKKNLVTSRPTKIETDQFEVINPILDSIYTELKELSKKKQDGALNETKVKLINRVLEKVKEFLINEPTIEFLDLLDEITLPTNSDSVLIIAQFKAAMVQFKSKHYTWNGIDYTWNTSD